MVSVLSFGGGVNSTAMLLLLVDRGEHPDLVLFADTGGERPETYAHVREMALWMAKRTDCDFAIVSNGSQAKGMTLEENCLRRKELPSLAYGFKGCSVKWKRQPMDRYVRDWRPASDAWLRGEKVTRYIGIDAGEGHRTKLPPDDKYVYRYPLVEHNLDRRDCVALIERHGIAVPAKSSCFFCPAMRAHEILALPRDLQERAVTIEKNAATHTVVGLGRSWKWADLISNDRAQMKLFPAPPPEVPCGCMDESDDE